CLLLFFVFFFFFQAEDGIRDFHVTGVQTCALPISNQGDAWVYMLDRLRNYNDRILSHEEEHLSEPKLKGSLTRPLSFEELPEERSEERRVGKECRSRWSRYHSTKKEKCTRKCESRE